MLSLPLDGKSRKRYYHTFEYSPLGRGNDVRISKVGKSLASNPAFRHQARSSSAMDGNSRPAFFPRFSTLPFLPTWVLSHLVSTPVTYVARKIAAERFARYSVLHARLPSPRLSFFASCAWIRSLEPAWWILLLDRGTLFVRPSIRLLLVAPILLVWVAKFFLSTWYMYVYTLQKL